MLIEDDDELIETDAAETSEDSEQDEQSSDDAEGERTTADFVKDKRAEMRGSAKPTEKNAPASKKKSDSSASDKDDEEEGGDEADPGDKGKGDGAKPYTEAELEEFVTNDIRRADMKRVPPALRGMITKMQKAEQRRHDNVEQRLRDAEQRAPKKAGGKDDEEEEDIPFTEEELGAIFASKKGRAMLKRVLEEEGIDFTVSRNTAQRDAVDSAIAVASKKHPEMKDEKFFNAVIDAIEDDDEWNETFTANNKNPKVMAGVFKAACAEVKSRTATAEKKQVDRDKAKIVKQKERLNAKTASHVTKSQARGSDEAPTTVDFVRQRRAELRGRA
jgi:hypothetical protein